MRSEVRMSVNPLAEFMSASDAKKNSIIKSQKNPSTFRISWYVKSKSAMTKFYKNPEDTTILEEVLEELKAQKTQTNWQHLNRKGSIDLLERFITMKVPSALKRDGIDFIQTKKRDFKCQGVVLIAAPNLIFKVRRGDKWHYGAVKFHTSKTGKFDRSKSRKVATLLMMYLRSFVSVEDPDALVDPSMCLCVDVFSGTITTAPSDSAKIESEISKACKDIIKFWDAA